MEIGKDGMVDPHPGALPAFLRHGETQADRVPTTIQEQLPTASTKRSQEPVGQLPFEIWQNWLKKVFSDEEAQAGERATS